VFKEGDRIIHLATWFRGMEATVIDQTKLIIPLSSCRHLAVWFDNYNYASNENGEVDYHEVRVEDLEILTPREPDWRL